jgi:putative protease
MKPELLLPVGNMPMLLAAIHHGADAVYMGVPYFNARGRTTDFDLDDLKEMIDLAHLYGVRVNLALNVVIFQNEFPKLVELLEKIIPMHPDAFIVQDLGVASLIRSMAPEQRIHASTQMTVTNSDAIKLVEDLKIHRFVLGRENSILEIQSIREETDKELEVFVHGALCVAYSGQCFTSESLGGRSANRGQCAQSCRLPYELYVDDEKKEMGEKKYLVSPKDLMGIAEVPKLKEIGVNSFKIEGRLKTPEYVASAAKNYRAVLDGENLNLAQRSRDLSVTYSRGFFNGWLDGVNHQKLVDGTYSAHRGIEVGSIKEIKKSTFIIESPIELNAGLGVLVVGEKEMGSTIFKATQVGPKIKNSWEVEFLQKNLKLKTNDKVYLNSDPKLEKELQKAWLSREDKKRIPVEIQVKGTLSSKLQVSMIDPEGRVVSSESESLLEKASNRSLTLDFIFDELSALGASVYQTAKKSGDLGKNLFINQRELKEIKRDLIQKMNDLRVNYQPRFLHKAALNQQVVRTTGDGLLNILVRTKAQADGLIKARAQGRFDHLEHKIGLIILDFEFGKDYGLTVQALKKANFKTAIATTRILKPKEYHNLKLIIRTNPDKILVRNLGALEYLRKECSIPLIGDFSLNVTNSYSHEYLLSKGLESICCSYDLNQSQLFDFFESADTGKVEVTLHQYMPEFHMEHCVFAAFLSTGSSFRDCGKPCEKHDVKLKDPYGNWHYLKADHECRNTFYKATPQSASFLIAPLLAKNIAALRIEALKETPEELSQKIVTYLKLICGLTTEAEALDELKIHESYGLGAGQLNVKDNYKNRKKEAAFKE